MIRIEREHYFAMPVEAGFAFITDTSSWPRYWPGFVRIECRFAVERPGRRGPHRRSALGRKLSYE